MGLFGNKREKAEKVDKYEYHASSKAARPRYGPPAVQGASPYLPPGPPYFDGFGQVAPQGKLGLYGGLNKSLYGGDPMQQAMLLPPQSQAAFQAQAAAMLQMQPYMQAQGGNVQFGGVFPPIQMSLGAAQQAGLVSPQVGQQMPPYFGFGGQQMQQTPYYDPNNGALPQVQQPGAFAPYQQPNLYDPASAAMYPGPYGYMPAVF